jgi:hypothetical protein
VPGIQENLKDLVRRFSQMAQHAPTHEFAFRQFG